MKNLCGSPGVRRGLDLALMCENGSSISQGMAHDNKLWSHLQNPHLCSQPLFNSQHNGYIFSKTIPMKERLQMYRHRTSMFQNLVIPSVNKRTGMSKSYAIPI